MNRTAQLTHYLDTAQYLRKQGLRRWASVYAKLALRLMEA